MRSEEKAESMRVALSACQEAATASRDKVLALELTRAHLEEVVARLHKQVNSLVAQVQAGWKPLRVRGRDVGTSPLAFAPSGTPHRGRSPARALHGTTMHLAHSPMRSPTPVMQHGSSPRVPAVSPAPTLAQAKPLIPLVPSTLPSTTNLSIGEAVHMYNNTWTLAGATYRALRLCPTFQNRDYQVFIRVKQANDVHDVLVDMGVRDPVKCMDQYLEGKKLGEKLYQFKKQKLSVEKIAELVIAGVGVEF